MRFLRMLTNALLAGALGAAYLTVIVLQLNPHVPIFSATTGRWFATLELFYGLHLAVLFYVLMVGREFITLDRLSPGWASVRVLAWLASVAATMAAVLMWLNVGGLAAALGETAVRRTTAGAVATTGCALVLFALAAAHYSFGRRGSRVGAALLSIAVFGSIALPLVARGPAVPAPAPLTAAGPAIAAPPDERRRVTLLLLDGASLDYVWPRAAEGRLPNFARMLEAGASLDLATVRPTGPDPVWTAVATGLYPSRNGIRATARYYAFGDARPVSLLPEHAFAHVLVRFGLVGREQNASVDLAARPLWAILSRAGVSAGVVRWPLTYPAAPIDGFVLSDRFHALLGSPSELDGRAPMAFPAEALPIARAAFVEQDPAASSAPQRVDEPEVSAAIRDRLYGQATRELRRRLPVRFLAVRFQGLDTLGHYYWGDTQPAGLDPSSDDERRAGGRIMERYYGEIDREVGDALATLGPGDVLLVVSGFGMERQTALKALVGRAFGDPMNGTHERAPDGFLLAYGGPIARGRLQRGSIVDVAPTVLYLFGLPIGRDMDGYARADLFTRAFTANRPIAFIPSYSR